LRDDIQKKYSWVSPIAPEAYKMSRQDLCEHILYGLDDDAHRDIAQTWFVLSKLPDISDVGIIYNLTQWWLETGRIMGQFEQKEGNSQLDKLFENENASCVKLLLEGVQAKSKAKILDALRLMGHNFKEAE